MGFVTDASQIFRIFLLTSDFDDSKLNRSNWRQNLTFNLAKLWIPKCQK